MGEIIGIFTGDKVRQHEGVRDEAKGNVKGVVNKLENAVRDTVEGVNQTVKKI